MNFLSVEQLTKSYGERLLFSELTFGIEQGQKAAIVAKNVGINPCPSFGFSLSEFLSQIVVPASSGPPTTTKAKLLASEL